MSVNVTPFRNGGWEVDIRIRFPYGKRHRERVKAPVTSKSGAQRWGEDRESHLLKHGLELPKKEVPTLEQFQQRFIDGYAKANRQKPSGIAAKETILRVHLVPELGSCRLDEITNERVQRLKLELGQKKRAAKTINNVLTVLNVLLRTAIEWGVIDAMPCRVRVLPTPKSEARFHDFDAYAGLIDAAGALDSTTQLVVLLGGDAGLRCGEIMALEWRDVDLAKRQLCVARSDWKGHVTATKSGRLRYVPMTIRLAEALRRHRHLKSARVVCGDDGGALTQKIVQCFVARAARRAEVRAGVHMLRHTFCSHLAMRGAPARAIQELAGLRISRPRSGICT